MTPCRYYNSADVYSSISSFLLNNIMKLYVSNNYGIRPVINLKADVKVLSGDGSKDNPYVIE